MDENTPIVDKQADAQKSTIGILYGAGESPRQRYLLIACMGAVALSVLVCLVLCIYNGVEKQSQHLAYPFLYFMFALTTIGLAAVHIIMVIFMKKGHISQDKIWFSYVSTVLVVLQSTFIGIVVSV